MHEKKRVYNIAHLQNVQNGHVGNDEHIVGWIWKTSFTTFETHKI
jgi:hypothetical protein